VVLVGSLDAADQHVTLPGIDTHTRARALRAPCWVIVLGVQLLGGSEALSRLLSVLLSSGS
jgi:hypothetical protein